MIKRVKIKPAQPHLIVRDPAGYMPLPAEGAMKNLNSYWLRRIADGSVVEVVEDVFVPKKVNVTKAAEAK